MTAESPPPSRLPDLASVGSEAQARLDALAPRLPASFRFDWQGILFEGRLGTEAPAAVHLTGDLGGLRYSAEDALRRQAALEMLARRDGPRFRRTVGNRLTLQFAEPLDGPPDMRRIVTAITLALLKARAAIEDARPLVAAPA